MTCKEVFDIVKPVFSPIASCVIAGGAPRDELLGRSPKDYDVFVLLGDDQMRRRDDVILASEGLFTETTDDDSSSPNIVRQGLLDGHNVQVMVVPFLNYVDLIDSFDWNICRFVWTCDDLINLCEDPHALLPGSFLKLHTVSRPFSTLRRGFRFCEKYGMLIEPSAITRLCTEILANTIRSEVEEESIPDLVL